MHKRLFSALLVLAVCPGQGWGQPATPTKTTPRTGAALPKADSNASTKRVSELMGLNVQDAKGETVGEISDLMLDENGQVVYVALSIGGFLGIGDKLYAIPFDALQYGHDGDDSVATLDVTPETFKNAQGFGQDQWPDMNDRRWRENTDSTYKSVKRSQVAVNVDGVDADNTGLNARDTNADGDDPRNWTAFDQSNDQADIDLVAKLRSEVLDIDDLSVNGRNIKIITNGGQVVLRGPVNSADERTAIETVVRRVADGQEIHNLLEVEKNP